MTPTTSTRRLPANRAARLTPPFAATGLTMTVAALTLLALPGCGESPQSELDASFEKLSRAEAGYVPGDANLERSYDGYRVEQLTSIEATLPSGGSAAEQFAAAQVRSEIKANEALLLLRDTRATASVRFANAAVLHRYVQAVTAAQGAVRELSRDEAELQRKLAQLEAEHTRKLEALRQTVSNLQSQAKRQQAEVEEHAERASTLSAQADRLESRAFTAERQQAFDLRNEANDVRRQAAQVRAKADEAHIHLDATNAELKRARREVELNEALVRDVNAQRRTLGQREASREQSLGAARQERDRAVQELVERVDARLATVKEQVLAPLDEAVTMFESALSAADQAVGRAPRSDRSAGQSAKALRLDRLVGLAGALASQVNANRRMATLIDEVLAPLPESVAGQLNEARAAAETFRQAADAANQRLTAVAGEANSLAEEMAGSAGQDSPEAILVASMRDALAAHQRLARGE